MNGGISVDRSAGSRSHGVVVSTQDFESCDPSSSLGGTYVTVGITFDYPRAHNHTTFRMHCVPYSLFPGGYGNSWSTAAAEVVDNIAGQNSL